MITFPNCDQKASYSISSFLSFFFSSDKTLFVIEFYSEAATSLFPLGALVIASLLPLYYFNFKKKRKVFLGDGGSLLLGTLVMVYLLYVLGPDYHLKTDLQANKVLFTVLVTLYPLVDLFRVFILRIKDGQSPFVADQRHIHHMLLKLSNHITVLILILITFTIPVLIYLL